MSREGKEKKDKRESYKSELLKYALWWYIGEIDFEEYVENVKRIIKEMEKERLI